MPAFNICKEKKFDLVLVFHLPPFLNILPTFYSIEIFIALTEWVLVWVFVRNDIINVKILNIVTPKMMCFDHTLTVAKHFKILPNVDVTLLLSTYSDTGHTGWHLKGWHQLILPQSLVSITRQQQFPASDEGTVGMFPRVSLSSGTWGLPAVKFWKWASMAEFMS